MTVWSEELAPGRYDKFNVAGRGTIININRHDYDWALSVKIGDVVKAEGKTWKVRGIERFVKPMDPPIPGDNVGLQVTEWEIF